MKNNSRDWGIDLVRIISTYGIVVIHSGGYGTPSGNLAIELPNIFRFALPFFLAASFYLISNQKKEYKLFDLIYSRWNRLIIPYLIWSLIYLVSRIIKQLISARNADLTSLFEDPFSIIFFGASAVHLYFLPLLFIGNLFEIAIRKFTTNFKFSCLLFLNSLIIYNIALQAFADFSMKQVTFYEVFYSLQVSAMQPIIKLLLIQGWFIIICLPYIFFARMIHTYPYKLIHISLYIKKYLYPLLISLFLIVIIVGRTLIPSFINEPILGCLFLILALNFPFLPEKIFLKKIVLNLSEASFGIYLIHHLIINFSELLISKIYPNFMNQVSILSLLLFSVSGFFISWLVVNIFQGKVKNRVDI
jgi:peptidoglycan/LPS O-acetylase OafA/YrhL